MPNVADLYLFTDNTQTPDVSLVHEQAYGRDEVMSSGHAWGTSPLHGLTFACDVFTDNTQTPDVSLVWDCMTGEDGLQDIGVVRADIFGNEINNQRWHGGIA